MSEQRVEPAWPIHPVGTVGICEDRLGVVIGKSDGARRWQWLNGDWTAIPLGTVTVLGDLRDLTTPEQPESPTRDEERHG